MSGRAVALWGAQIRAGENIVAAAEFADLPVPVSSGYAFTVMSQLAACRVSAWLIMI